MNILIQSTVRSILVVMSFGVIAAACGSDEVGMDSGAILAIEATVTVEMVATPSVPSDPQDMPPDIDPQGWEGVNVGLPAIIPTLPVEAGRPTFTEQDVRDYIASHPPSYTDTSKPITVKRVEFLPVGDVEVRINHAVSVPRDTLLCLATVQGTWVPPSHIKVYGTQDPDSVLYLIFDATTGNFLAETSGIESD